MAFTTLTFTLFFAAVFSLYWILRRRTPQNILLLIASYVFYAAWDYRFCALLLINSLVDFAVGLALERSTGRARRRSLLGISLASNLGLLAFFKYSNFFIENLRALMASVGWHSSLPSLKILLPIGISFYTFKTLSYTIDVYRREMKATSRPLEYLAFVSFFPQLLAGPIDRASHLLPQFLAARKFSYPVAVDGCRQILLGFFKKLVLAENLAPIVDLAYRTPELMSGPQLALATVCFAFQLYLDFSAYSDIAIGLAKLLGFDSMRNFAYPYFSQSMAEFWRRWHISLTTWFRDYVYFSMGGVRGTRLRRSFNVVVTFVLSGLWHGASWNFVVWGGINGVAVLPEMFRKRGRKPSAQARWLTLVRVALKIIVTFVVTCIAWVFFRAQNLSHALLILKKILLGFWNVAAERSLWPVFNTSRLGTKLFLLLAVYVLVEWLQRNREHPLTLDFWPKPVRWVIYSAMLWMVFRYAPATPTGEFIYFKF